jgi:hypothetical protein
VSTNDLITTAKAWLAAEPDDDIRDELASLIADAEAGHPSTNSPLDSTVGCSSVPPGCERRWRRARCA